MAAARPPTRAASGVAAAFRPREPHAARWRANARQTIAPHLGPRRGRTGRGASRRRRDASGWRTRAAWEGVVSERERSPRRRAPSSGGRRPPPRATLTRRPRQRLGSSDALPGKKKARPKLSSRPRVVASRPAAPRHPWNQKESAHHVWCAKARELPRACFDHAAARCTEAEVRGWGCDSTPRPHPAAPDCADSSVVRSTD